MQGLARNRYSVNEVPSVRTCESAPTEGKGVSCPWGDLSARARSKSIFPPILHTASASPGAGEENASVSKPVPQADTAALY